MTVKLIYSIHAKKRAYERRVPVPNHVVVDPSSIENLDGWKSLLRAGKSVYVIVPAQESGYFVVKTVWSM